MHACVCVFEYMHVRLSLCECVHVSACVCVYTCNACEPIYIFFVKVEARSQDWMSFSVLYTLVFEAGFLTGFRAYRFNYAEWPVIFSDPSSSQALELQVHTIMPGSF